MAAIVRRFGFAIEYEFALLRDFTALKEKMGLQRIRGKLLGWVPNTTNMLILRNKTDALASIRSYLRDRDNLAKIVPESLVLDDAAEVEEMAQQIFIRVRNVIEPRMTEIEPHVRDLKKAIEELYIHHYFRISGLINDRTLAELRRDIPITTMTFAPYLTNAIIDRTIIDPVMCMSIKSQLDGMDRIQLSNILSKSSVDHVYEVMIRTGYNVISKPIYAEIKNKLVEYLCGNCHQRPAYVIYERLDDNYKWIVDALTGRGVTIYPLAFNPIDDPEIEWFSNRVNGIEIKNSVPMNTIGHQRDEISDIHDEIVVKIHEEGIAGDALIDPDEYGYYPYIIRYPNTTPVSSWLGATHLNFTMPYRPDTTEHMHHIVRHILWMKMVQLLEPLFLACFTCTHGQVFDDNHHNMESSPRFFSSFFNFLSTPISDRLYLEADKYGEERKFRPHDLVLAAIENAGINTDNILGADFRVNHEFHKPAERDYFGFEFRFLDHIPINDIARIAKIICWIGQYAIILGSHIAIQQLIRLNPIQLILQPGDDAVNMLTAIMKEGWNAPVAEYYLTLLARFLPGIEIPRVGIPNPRINCYDVLNSIINQMRKLLIKIQITEDAGTNHIPVTIGARLSERLRGKELVLLKAFEGEEGFNTRWGATQLANNIAIPNINRDSWNKLTHELNPTLARTVVRRIRETHDGISMPKREFGELVRNMYPKLNENATLAIEEDIMDLLHLVNRQYPRSILER